MANEQQALIPSIGNYLNNANIRKFIEGMLKERTGSFITSLVSLQNLDKKLQGCDPNSLMMCGLKAASLGLPLDPNLGQAYPVPYENKQPDGTKLKEVQLQIGYKGFIQLAQKTSQYKKVILTDIRVGELVTNDPINDIYIFAPILYDEKRSKLPITHYYFSFELISGFKKEFLWTIGKIIAHAKRYSKAFGNGPWQTNQDEMCKKTMIRLHLPKWGPMSIELQQAVAADQAILKLDEATGQELPPDYPDNPVKNGVIETTGHVVDETETTIEDEDFKKFKEEKERQKATVAQAQAEPEKVDKAERTEKTEKPDKQEKTPKAKSAEGQQDVFDAIKEASK